MKLAAARMPSTTAAAVHEVRWIRRRSCWTSVTAMSEPPRGEALNGKKQEERRHRDEIEDVAEVPHAAAHRREVRADAHEVHQPGQPAGKRRIELSDEE